jgi:hypothetical protein
MRRLLRVLATLALVAGGLTVSLVPATAADAATSCSGNLVLTKDLMYNQTKIGELDIWYNSSTGVNCAKMNHGGPTWGVARDTWVYIAKCRATTNTGTCEVTADDHQEQVVQYYAGPVSVTAGSHCVQANGWIYWDGATRKVATGQTVLCG